MISLNSGAKMTNYIITAEKIKALIQELAKQNWNIISESQTGTNFVYINDGKDLVLNSNSRPSKLSMKEYFFPKTEPLFFYKKNHQEVELLDPKSFENKTVVFGAKPCDAAAIPIMKKVMNWDYADDFFNKRDEKTVIIGMSCNYEDEYCFCESVGLSPNSEKGSDVFLTEAEGKVYLAKVVTEKGEKFINDYKAFFAPSSNGEIKLNESERKNIQKKFDYSGIKSWLDSNFKNEYWKGLGELCLGCAQCAFVCPTCHCFDIVDEDCKLNCGRRVKNWDACQFGLFTKHASGHNPRENQGERYRQRINHKFKYYQDKFEEILCTGCGRCTRGCSVGIDIGQILEEINMMQKKSLN